MFVSIDVSGKYVYLDEDAVKTFESMNKEEKDLMCKWIIADRSHTALFDKNKIKEVIFNGPATVVFWKDGTKTVVKCMDGDRFNYETGIAMCMLKRIYGNSYGNFKKYLKEVVEKENKKNEKKTEHNEEKTASGSDANN